MKTVIYTRGPLLNRRKFLVGSALTSAFAYGPLTIGKATAPTGKILIGGFSIGASYAFENLFKLAFSPFSAKLFIYASVLVTTDILIMSPAMWFRQQSTPTFTYRQHGVVPG
jgi:hypothetical protein